MNHDELTQAAIRHFLNRRDADIDHVFTEAAVSKWGERPDAVFFMRHDQSRNHRWLVLIESKATRSDWLSDPHKPHRRGQGIGDFRWLVTPPGVVADGELYPRWGHLLCIDGEVVEEKVPAEFNDIDDPDPLERMTARWKRAMWERYLLAGQTDQKRESKADEWQWLVDRIDAAGGRVLYSEAHQMFDSMNDLAKFKAAARKNNDQVVPGVYSVKPMHYSTTRD